MIRHIAEGYVQRFRRQMRRTVWPNHRAAKAKPAIDRTNVQQFQERAIGVAVDNAFDRAEQKIAGRIGHFSWQFGELGHIRNELAGNRIERIGGVYQRRDRAGQANRIGRGDSLGRVAFGFWQKTGFDEVRGAAQGCWRFPHLSSVPC
jgi:hypothetical protein